MLLCTPLLHAQFSLSEAQGYNLITFGDFTGNFSDVEGGAAVGGNATLTSYSINSSGTALPGNAALVVGGDLEYNNGQVFDGDVHVGGSLINSPSVPDGDIYTGSTPFGFSNAYNQFASQSANYATYTPTGVAENNFGTLTINATDPIMNVFELSVADLSGVHTFNINNTGGQLLINVVGTASANDLSMMYMGMTVSDPESLLFNLIGIETFTLAGIKFSGSVLAMDTDVNFNFGELNGQLIANSLDGTGELHARFFTGNESVPEPSTYGLLGACLLSLLVLRRSWERHQYAT